MLRHVKTTSEDPALLVGLDAPDDAAVYQIASDVAVVQTVDFFTPIVDDPHAWGRIAAANALSDVYAMGGEPITALGLVAWPRSLDVSLLGRVLDGASGACEEAGVAIVGGHSIDDPEPKFGLAVTGTVRPDAIVRKSGARPGAKLVLTKPLGMGIVSSGIKQGLTDAELAAEAAAVMGTLNAAARDAMVAVGVQAATDVTGFGLAGHLLQMLAGAEISAHLSWSAIPVIDRAVELAGAGVYPGGSKRNRDALQDRFDATRLQESQAAVLFDAQTSGGLLIAVAEDRLDALLDELERRGVSTRAVIGDVISGDGMVQVSP